MCGRFTLTAPKAELLRLMGPEAREVPGLDGQQDWDQPRCNIAPTQSVLLWRQEDGHPLLASHRWGLVPSWARDASFGSKLINARSETVAEKPSFRSAFRDRRCLIFADGFYEWEKLSDRRQPWHFRFIEGVSTFAGLWERWQQPDGADLWTTTLLTTEANATVAPVHPRMPVILDAQARACWLSPSSTRSHLENLLVPANPAVLEATQV